VLGHPNVLPNLVAEHHVAEIVVVPGAMAWESFQQILEQMSTPEQNGPRIRLSPGYYDLLATTPRVAHRNFVPLFVVDSARLTGFDALLKTLLDFGLGSLMLVLSLPLDLVILFSRARAGRGQLFVTEEYQGIGGRPFGAAFASRPGDWLAAGSPGCPCCWRCWPAAGAWWGRGRSPQPRACAIGVGCRRWPR
jgi:hypothetical protein